MQISTAILLLYCYFSLLKS